MGDEEEVTFVRLAPVWATHACFTAHADRRRSRRRGQPLVRWDLGRRLPRGRGGKAGPPQWPPPGPVGAAPATTWRTLSLGSRACPDPALSAPLE